MVIILDESSTLSAKFILVGSNINILTREPGPRGRFARRRRHGADSVRALL